MEENQLVDDGNILFHITKEQATKIVNHFNKQFEVLEDYEICELLDEIIDNLPDNTETEDDLPF